MGKYLLLFFIAALALRLGIASQDLAYLDRLFFPDDTYYTLTISRFIAEGFGPSVDGEHLTSGFQPLITLFQLPLFSLTSDLDQVAHWAAYQTAVFGALSTLLIGLILKRIEPVYTPIIGMGLWVIAPLAIAGDINGLETSLAGLVNLAVVYAAIRVDESRSALWMLIMGVLCAVALVTRIDTCFVVAMVGLYGWYRWGFVRIAIVAAIALAVIAPWWIYLYVNFGSFIPESGKAIVQIFELGTGGGVLMRVMAALIGLAKVPEWIVPSFWHPFADYPLRLIGLVLIAMMVRKAWTILQNHRQQARPGVGVIQALFLSQLVVMCFYLLVVPGFWFFSRYFYTLFLVLTLALAVGVGHVLANHTGSWIERLKQQRFWAFMLAAVTVTSLVHVPRYFSQPEIAEAIKLTTFRGYRDIAKDLLVDLPENSVMGASQSGAFGYYAKQYSPGSLILNLDGVVNKKAYEAVKERQLKKYLQSVNMTHVAEYEIKNTLPNVFGAPFDEACLSYMKESPHGNLAFTLYDVTGCL